MEHEEFEKKLKAAALNVNEIECIHLPSHAFYYDFERQVDITIYTRNNRIFDLAIVRGDSIEYLVKESEHHEYWRVDSYLLLLDSLEPECLIQSVLRFIQEYELSRNAKR